MGHRSGGRRVRGWAVARETEYRARLSGPPNTASGLEAPQGAGRTCLTIPPWAGESEASGSLAFLWAMSSCLCCSVTPPPPSSSLSVVTFIFFFPIIMRDHFLQTALEVCSAPPPSPPSLPSPPCPSSCCVMAPSLTVGGYDVTASTPGTSSLSSEMVPREGRGWRAGLEWDVDPGVGMRRGQRRCVGHSGWLPRGDGLTLGSPFCPCSLAEVPGRGLRGRRAVQPGDHRRRALRRCLLRMPGHGGRPALPAGEAHRAQ